MPTSDHQNDWGLHAPRVMLAYNALIDAASKLVSDELRIVRSLRLQVSRFPNMIIPATIKV